MTDQRNIRILLNWDGWENNEIGYVNLDLDDGEEFLKAAEYLVEKGYLKARGKDKENENRHGFSITPLGKAFLRIIGEE